MVIGGLESVFRVIQYVNSTTVFATVIIQMSGASAGVNTTDWAESAYSDYRGWPKTVCFFRRRLVWGGNDAEPDRIWASQVDNIYHMTSERLEQDKGSSTDVTGVNYFGDPTDSDPFDVLVGDQETSGITWMTPLRSLNIGTLKSEYVQQGNFNLSEVAFIPQTAFGGQASMPVRVNNHVTYITRDGKRVRNFRFSESNGSNISVNLSLLAEHLGRKGIIAQYYQVSEDLIWMVDADKKLISVSYDPESDLVAWSQHDLGLDYEVNGIAAVQHPDGDYSSLFISVSRTINAATVYTIERLNRPFLGDSLNNASTSEEDIPVFTDNSVIETLGAPGQILSGLSHLEGETLTVTKDGYLLGTFTVAGGQIDLGTVYTTGTRFVSGLPFTALLDTLDIERGGDFGTAQGLIQRIDRVVTRFFKSFGVKIGVPDGQTDPVQELSTDVEELVDSETMLPSSPARRQRIRVESSDPYPCNVVSMSIRGNTYD
jgi:hypothetical protein